MMKKMWKNNKAVSPVIATILMVAITVVLAAVLYVMVMGFGGSGTTSAPTASLTNSGNKLVLSISKPYAMTDSTLQVIVGTSCKLNYTTGSTLSHAASPAVTTTITFVDAGGDAKVSTGDYFTNSGSAVTVKVVWTSGGTSQIIAEGTV
jgi:archaeal type IV pilus assembly protein PilA